MQNEEFSKQTPKTCTLNPTSIHEEKWNEQSTICQSKGTARRRSGMSKAKHSQSGGTHRRRSGMSKAQFARARALPGGEVE
jgi:hypothetical protein